MTRAYLFDLDMTLVDTNALATLRRARLWPQVKKNMHLMRPFPANGRHAPHEVPGLLHEAGEKVAIVTSSPRWYAEAVTDQFDIPYDVLVGYEDTEDHKPDPAPIVKALERLKLKPGADIVYVGDDANDFEASYRAGITSVGVRWSPTSVFELSSAAPDVFIEKPSLLLPPPDRIPKLGYAAECFSRGSSYIYHWGTVLHCDDDPIVYALGRYFTTTDSRHASSPLCAAILALKSEDSQAGMLGQALGKALRRMDWMPDYIVPVPPKPSQERIRFARLLEEGGKVLGKVTRIELAGLRCVKDIEGYKAMKALERQKAMRGAFVSDFNWHGNDVLLVDDVYTTGETIKECTRVLKRSGAGEVRCMVLGKDQRTFEGKDCPACGRAMRVRTNSQSGDKFWGCSGYPDSCRHTEKM